MDGDPILEAMARAHWKAMRLEEEEWDNLPNGFKNRLVSAMQQAVFAAETIEPPDEIKKTHAAMLTVTWRSILFAIGNSRLR